VEAIRCNVARLCEPLGHNVYAVVNYDGFSLARDVEDAYLAMVQDVVERYYLGVTRYTTSSFMRAKLGKALAERGAAAPVRDRAGSTRKPGRRDEGPRLNRGVPSGIRGLRAKPYYARLSNRSRSQ